MMWMMSLVVNWMRVCMLLGGGGSSDEESFWGGIVASMKAPNDITRFEMVSLPRSKSKKHVMEQFSDIFLNNKLQSYKYQCNNTAILILLKYVNVQVIPGNMGSSLYPGEMHAD